MSKSILMVEDNAELANSLKELLVEIGFTVISATRFSEALQRTNNQKFSCILMDLQLESGSGLKAIQQIRGKFSKRSLNFETPIILMSGYLEPDVIKLTLGQVQGVLAKPFDAKVLIEKIHKVMDEQKPSRAHAT